MPFLSLPLPLLFSSLLFSPFLSFPLLPSHILPFPSPSFDPFIPLLCRFPFLAQANMTSLGLKGSRAHILQILATYKFDDKEMVNTDLDVLTGFQIIDGKIRLIVVEGLVEGAMGKIKNLIEKTVGAAPKTTILYNAQLKYSKRLYASLGAQIRPIKLMKALTSIMADCQTHAGRKVREQCREGLKRIASLCTITWLRQADRLQLLPTATMLNYVDKKFGGELTKTDEYGADADVSDDVSAPSTKRTSSTAKGSHYGEEGAASKYSYSKPKVDFENDAFIEEKARRDELRKTRDFFGEYLDHLQSIQVASQSIRNEWHTWNPQRITRPQGREGEGEEEAGGRSSSGAGKESSAGGGGGGGGASDGGAWGAQTFEEPDTLTGGRGAKDGKPRPEFIWPAPKMPGQYNSHPKKPTKARIEELAQPWLENEYHAAPMMREDERDIIPFKTIMPAPAILEKVSTLFFPLLPLLPLLPLFPSLPFLSFAFLFLFPSLTFAFADTHASCIPRMRISSHPCIYVGRAW